MFVLLFIWFSYLPVSDPGIWHAVSTGSIALQSNSLDVLDTIPLSEGMRVSNMNWGANSVIHSLYAAGGAELLSLSFAVLKTVTLLLWAFLFLKFVGRWAAVAGVVPLVMCTFFELDGMNSQLFGQLMLPILILVMAQSNQARFELRMWSETGIGRYFAVGAIFAIWANLHASFVVGLALLFLLALARFVKHKFASFTDREFRARVWLLEIAALGTLLNPSGIYLWSELLWWPDNPVLQAFGGWSPTVLAGWNGMFIALFWASWFIANRRAKKLNWFFTLAAIFATMGAACCQGLIAWFAPMILMGVAIVLGALQSQVSQTPAAYSGPFRFAFTLLAGLFIWLGFCCSPAGSMLLGGHPRAEAQVVGAGTPILLKNHLSKKRPAGMVWAPVYWSDWLSVGSDSKMFLNANSNLVPETVLSDYGSFYAGENWKHLAEKYDFTNIVIDKNRQQKLTRQIRRSPGDWKIVFEDGISILLQRVTL